MVDWCPGPDKCRDWEFYPGPGIVLSQLCQKLRGLLLGFYVDLTVPDCCKSVQKLPKTVQFLKIIACGELIGHFLSDYFWTFLMVKSWTQVRIIFDTGNWDFIPPRKSSILVDHWYNVHRLRLNKINHEISIKMSKLQCGMRFILILILFSFNKKAKCGFIFIH